MQSNICHEDSKGEIELFLTFGLFLQGLAPKTIILFFP